MARNLRQTTPMMKGPDVKEVQEKLYSLGYLRTKPDGTFGPNTKAAVIRFQEAMGLEMDGIVGKSTARALSEAKNIEEPSKNPKEENSLSPTAISKRMSLWGFDSLIEAKGKTYAMKQFQAALGLSVDGYAGPKTQEALMSTPIYPRIEESEMKCQCNSYCDGTPEGEVSIGVRIFAERVMREVEKAYPGTQFFISTKKTPTPGGGTAGGYRCERWNRERGGAAGSKHKEGIALDLFGRSGEVKDSIIRQKIEDVAMKIGTKCGIGYGGRHVVHMDTRGRADRWKYN